jgi:hypothetical protein
MTITDAHTHTHTYRTHTHISSTLYSRSEKCIITRTEIIWTDLLGCPWRAECLPYSTLYFRRQPRRGWCQTGRLKCRELVRPCLLQPCCDVTKHTHTRTHAQTHARTNTHTRTHAQTHARTHKHIHTHTRAHARAVINLHAYVTRMHHWRKLKQ